jgi:hypothetical protein
VRFPTLRSSSNWCGRTGKILLKCDRVLIGCVAMGEQVLVLVLVLVNVFGKEALGGNLLQVKGEGLQSFRDMLVAEI